MRMLMYRALSSADPNRLICAPEPANVRLALDRMVHGDRTHSLKQTLGQHPALTYLSVAGQGEILAQGVSSEAVVGEDAAEIWVPSKEDAIHVPGLSLKPGG